ncbi:hypothetical protein [Kitasatospora purpeofusca]
MTTSVRARLWKFSVQPDPDGISTSSPSRSAKDIYLWRSHD